jgi:phage gp29-like protein
MTPYHHSDELSAMMMPPSLARMQAGPTAKPWNAVDGASFRPGYQLTPQRLWQIFRAAEVGNPAMQCDAFEDILENDGHLRGQYESRLSAVAFRPWIVLPGGSDSVSIECAAALWIALRRCNMLAARWHVMEALGYGWSALNVAWRFNPTTSIVEPMRFLCAPHRRFIINEAGNGELRFLTPEDAGLGVELPLGQWIVARRMHRKLVRAGFFRTTAWWALFKRMSITDWIVFAEKFGIPTVLGYYNEKASPESRAALLSAITDLGSDGQAILSDMTKIVVENAAIRFGDVGSLHPAITQRCDAEISKVVTGATLNVETGGPGSFALGKVHEGRATSLSFADASWVQEVFHEQLCCPFIEYNPRFASAMPPQLSIRVQPEMSPEIRVKVYQVLQAMGLKIEDEQMYEEFGLRKPDLGGELKPLYAVQQPTAPPPAPAS